jgi:hypothetical protein
MFARSNKNTVESFLLRYDIYIDVHYGLAHSFPQEDEPVSAA